MKGESHGGARARYTGCIVRDALVRHDGGAGVHVGLGYQYGLPRAQGGTGNWLGTSFWYIGGRNIAWSDGSDAGFGPSAGTVTVNGAVTADSLSFSNSGYTISGSPTLTLSGADTIEVTNSSDTATIGAPIGGSGGFTKTGAGTLIFNGSSANSFSGTATVADGTLNLDKTSRVNAITGNLTIGDGSGASSSATVTQGADHQIADTATVTINSDGFWNLASGNHSETVGALILNGSSVATGTGTLTVHGNLTCGNAGAPTVSGSLDLGSSTRTVSVITAYGLDISAAISNGGIIKTDPGLLTLSGTAANTYTGATTVQNGSLSLNKSPNVTAIDGDLVIGGMGNSAEVYQYADEQIANTATVTIGAEGFWETFDNSQTIAGLTLTGGVLDTGNFGNEVLTLNGDISGSGGGIGGFGSLDLGGNVRSIDVSANELHIGVPIANGAITKTGAGSLLLTGLSTFTGPVAINAGTVRVVGVADNGSASGLGAGSSISLDSGTLEYIHTGISGTTNRSLMLNSGGGTIAVTYAGVSLTLSGAISGVGGLTKTGPGTLVLAGPSANSYAGATAFTDGGFVLSKSAGVNAVPGDLSVGDGVGAAASAILTQANDEQIPDSATVTIAADGFWNLASGNHSETIAALTIAGGSIETGAGTLTVNGNITTDASAASATISGQLNLGGTTRTLDVADGTAAIDLDISAAISNGGINKTGDGTLQISGASNFSGPIAVNAGTLVAHGGSAIGDASDVTEASDATLTIDGNETIGSLTGAGATTITSGNTLTIAGSASTTFTGSFSGAGGLTKTGSGSLNVTTQPVYTGNTLVNGGTLALNTGLASGSGMMTVSVPGMLQAKGVEPRSIAGDGTITAIGTLTIGDGSSASGFAFDGTLTVGSNLVSLADVDSAQLGVATTLANFGRLDSINGIMLASGRSITASANATISGALANNGTINGPVASGQSLALLGDTSGTGNYTGHVDFAARFSPGASAAAVSLENFTLDSTATLAIELGGTTVGSEYDQLSFTGTGVLGGKLSISLINGFNPLSGNSFKLIAGGAFSGAFNSIELPALSGGLSWNTSALYTAGLLSVGLPGDYNGNGTVDAADYVVWRKGLGTNYSQTDYDVWRSHFGQSAGSGSGVSANVSVPEPATLVMLLTGVLALCSRRCTEVS